MSQRTIVQPRRAALVATLFLALAAGLVAQSTNDANASLVINNVDGAAPNLVPLVPPSTLDVSISGIPNSPFVLLHGANISVGEMIFGSGLSLDLGPFAAINVLANGLVPVNFLDFFANTGTGTTNLTFVVPGSILPGSIGGLQAVVVDFTQGPPFVAFTAATEIVINQPCDYGTAYYAVGSSTSSTDTYLGDGGSQTSTQVSLPSSNIDIETIYLSRFEHIFSNTSAPGPIDRFRAPTAARPIPDRSNNSFGNIKTIHGDLYSFEDASVSPSEFGYFLSTGGAAAPIEIPGSRLTNGTSTSTPWESEIQISNDSSTMAAVYDPLSGPDQIFLMRLDGSTFTQNGLSVIDVTPVGANATILEDSMRFTGNSLYFVDGTSAGALYQVAIDPAGPATAVTIPALGTGSAVTLVDGEMRSDGGLGDIYFIGEALSISESDLFRIDGATGMVSNVTNFATATKVCLFGDTYDGNDGHISVSPSGFTVAFVVELTNFVDELFVASPFGAFPLTHVTDDANFDPIIDTVIDINVLNDDEILYFLGATSTSLDVFHYRISTGVHTNVTGTSGDLAAPFVGTGTIDTDGYFNFNGRMIFSREGMLSFGPNAGTSAFNFVAVDHATLAVTNVTGDEFGGATSPNLLDTSPVNTRLCLAPNSDQIWFFTRPLATTDDELFTFDPNVVGVATQITNNGTSSGLLYDNITPNDLGTAVLVSVRPSGSTSDEEVAMATLGGSYAVLTDDLNPLSDITDGSLRFLSGVPCNGFMYAQGTNSTSTPTDATLNTYDLVANSTTVIDPTPGVYWVYSLGL